MSVTSIQARLRRASVGRARQRRGLSVAAVAALLAVAFPLVITVPYYQSIAILALLYIALAVAFDLVVGRIGALSLTQPVFLGVGAYSAGILSARLGTNFWVEAFVAVVLAAFGALIIGIPSFRLSMHSFAMATLAFAIGTQLIARNWIGLTGGPLCTTGIRPLRIPFPGGSFQPVTYTGLYYVALGIAALAAGTVAWIVQRRLGLGFTAVRDDDILSAARGLWPMELRLVAFAVSAALTALVGVFMAHFQTVVCPNVMDMSYTLELLIMVFIGGRGSLRGVITAAVLFTVLPQFLRLTEEWRLVIYGALLVFIVTTIPDGIEYLYRNVGRAISARRIRPPQDTPKDLPAAKVG